MAVKKAVSSRGLPLADFTTNMFWLFAQYPEVIFLPRK